MSRGIERPKKCLCGCGSHTIAINGYIPGHEPELDHTEYELAGVEVERKG